ncbi:MAG: PmoA family protein [Cyclobacteriaceae bacterium]
MNYKPTVIGCFLTLLITWTWTSGFLSQSGNEMTVDRNDDRKNIQVELIVREEEKKVEIFIDGGYFTSYLYSGFFKKPVLYPVNTARGTAITRGFPLDPRPGESTDHPHHVGLWLNYGDVNGLDFWNNSNNVSPEKADHYGSIAHKLIQSISSGEGQGELTVAMDWVGPGGEVLLTEHTTFVFKGSGNVRMIDRITKLTAPDQEVSMKDNKEGMLGLRVRRELEHPDEHFEATGIYRSSEGLEGYDVWGTRGKWVNLTGWIGDEQVSVAILDHPDNVGHPTYWHARGYGLFAANPLGQRALSGGDDELDFSIAAGETVTFKHRVVIYSGDGVTDDRVNADWNEFAGS